MTNLIAHLARRILAPSGIRPRAPARFETPHAMVPPADIEIEPAVVPSGGESPEAVPAAVLPRTVPAPLPAAPAITPGQQPAPPTPRPLPPEPATGMPVPMAVVQKPAPDSERMIVEPGMTPTARSASVTPPARESSREVHHVDRAAVIRETEIRQQREVHTRLHEQVQVQTERLLPPAPVLTTPAAPATVVAAAATPAAAAQPARPTVEIHIGRIEVQPLPPPTPALGKAGDEPRRAKGQSLEDYLSARSRERRRGP